MTELLSLTKLLYLIASVKVVIMALTLFSGAYTYAQDITRSEPLSEIAPLDLRYTLFGSYIDGKLRPEASFRHVLEQSRVSSEFGETVTPSFTLVDVKLSYQFSKSIRFSAGVLNLSDENYYEHLSRSIKNTGDPILAPGRNAFVSLNVIFYRISLDDYYIVTRTKVFKTYFYYGMAESNCLHSLRL